MFSGIVETIGTILSIEVLQGCKQFTIASHLAFDDIHIGDSIAVNGVCLTVTEFTEQYFKVTAVPETLRMTNLKALIPHQLVNLERALSVGDRIGGHSMQGHVDDIGHILKIEADHSDAWLVTISIPNRLAKYLIPKGYIALDGMSITVIDVMPDHFTVTLIPHTQRVTIAHQYQLETPINIEVDMMGKYIETLVQHHLQGQQ